MNSYTLTWFLIEARDTRSAATGVLIPGHDSELVGSAELRDQGLECLAHIPDGSICRITLAVSPNARAQLRMSAPDTVLVLFYGVRDVHSVGH
jgi:hypothetical protein